MTSIEPAQDNLIDLTLDQLRQRVKIKKYLANRIQEKCAAAGFNITIQSIYYTFNKSHNSYNAEVIKRAIISIIKEQEEKLSAIV